MNSDLPDKIKDLYSMLAVPLIAVIVGSGVLLGCWVGAGFILSGGDEQKIKQAKERLKHVIIGFIVLVAVGCLVPVFVGFLNEWAEK